MTQDQRETETVVVGAGAAGLTAAAFLVRTGQKVTVLEKSRACGGRAQTRNQDGFQFNVGPHALYLNGAGRQILAELQIPVQGSPPPHGWAWHGEKLYPLPRTAAGLWRSSLFSLAGKWAVTRFLAAFSSLSARELQAVSLAAWLAAQASATSKHDIFWRRRSAWRPTPPTWSVCRPAPHSSSSRSEPPAYFTLTGAGKP